MTLTPKDFNIDESEPASESYNTLTDEVLISDVGKKGGFLLDKYEIVKNYTKIHFKKLLIGLLISIIVIYVIYYLMREGLTMFSPLTTLELAKATDYRMADNGCCCDEFGGQVNTQLGNILDKSYNARTKRPIILDTRQKPFGTSREQGPIGNVHTASALVPRRDTDKDFNKIKESKIAITNSLKNRLSM